MTTSRGEWVTVPREPTPEMDAAGKHALSNNGVTDVDTLDALVCWKAMLAASGCLGRNDCQRRGNPMTASEAPNPVLYQFRTAPLGIRAEWRECDKATYERVRDSGIWTDATGFNWPSITRALYERPAAAPMAAQGGEDDAAVERVAKALYETEPFRQEPWIKQHPARVEYWRSRARAALAAAPSPVAQQGGFRAGVRELRASNGTTFVVYVERADREPDAFPVLENGFMTVRNCPERGQAEYEAAEWNYLFNGGERPDILAFPTTQPTEPAPSPVAQQGDAEGVSYWREKVEAVIDLTLQALNRGQDNVAALEIYEIVMRGQPWMRPSNPRAELSGE